jgi:AAA15 family ATPase/GTPase
LALLKSKAIFGPNGGGKTNLLRAMSCALLIIRNSFKDAEIVKELIIPFRLDQNFSAVHPTYFQIVFLMNDTVYRYGFTIVDDRVHEEWLFSKELGKKGKISSERYLFKRSQDDVTINKETFSEGRIIESLSSKDAGILRSDALLLSTLFALNRSISMSIVKYFEKYDVLAEPAKLNFFEIAKGALSDKVNKNKILSIIKSVDPTIDNLELVKVDSTSEDIQKTDPRENREVFLIRKDSEDQNTFFHFSTDEAEGTKRIFELSPFIIRSLESGGVLAIDELELRMHPHLTRRIIQLYNSSITNPNNAQLIFATHDTTLMDKRNMRRDQISFAQKGKDGSTHLYTLQEIGGVRNDASFEKDYLLGKYRAVPNHLNRFEDFTETYAKKDKKNKKDG